jgi:hypothetical protein
MSPHDRKGWYVKPAGRATVPAVWFSVVCHTRKRGVPGYFRLTEHELESVSAAVVYRKRTGWTHPQTVRVSTGEALREWMRERSLPRRVNWVITPRVDETLTLTEWFHVSETEGIFWREPRQDRPGIAGDDPAGDAVVLDRFALSPTVGIVRYAHRGRSWQWVGERQYHLGGRFGGGTGGGAPRVHREFDARVVDGQEGEAGGSAVAIAGRVNALCDWWRANSRAGFGCTTAQLAWGILRSHVPPRVLTTHQNADVHALERAAAFGGRASVWYVGAVGDTPRPAPRHVARSGDITVRREPGPLWNLDVRAMYPALLRDNRFPTKLAATPQNVTPRALMELAESGGVVARVTIHTRRAEYPYRSSRGVVYPIGTFTTTLTGPELLTLREDGEILTCHEVATYHLTDAFGVAAGFLLTTPTVPGAAGGASGGSFAKLLRNSLAGKLAQRAGGWVRDPGRDSPRQWGERWEFNCQTGLKTRRRWVMGLCWRWEDDASGRGPHTACFAYLAAYGRVMMRRWRDRIGERAVVSQHTDGLWVLDGRSELVATLPSKDDAEPGQLSNRGSVDSARFWGPGHYWTSDGWTLAGFHEPGAGEWGKSVWDTQQPLPWNGKTRRAPRTVVTENRLSALTLDAPFGTVLPDGWILPRQIFPRKDGSEREAG